MRMQLNKKRYEVLKSMDFSAIDNDIVLYDDTCEFETNNPLFDVVFDINIITNGMDENQNECTEYGKQLYELYDLIFFSKPHP